MLRRDRRGTVRHVSIRSAISGLLAGDRLSSDPSAALEEAGYEGVSAEEFGTALTHFADTATLAEADALAPVVTRMSPIPLTEADLADLALDSEPGDAFSLFSETVTTVPQDYGESDLDDLDIEPRPEAIDEGSEGADALDEADFRFGEPASAPQPRESFDDEVLEDEVLEDEVLDNAPDAAALGQVEPTSFDELEWDEAFESDDSKEPIDTADTKPGEFDDTFDDELDIDA